MAGRVGADLDATRGGVDADEGAGALAHRVELHQGDGQEHAGHVRVGPNIVLPAVEYGDVERGAPDVGAEDVLHADPLAEPLGADDPADRAGDQGPGELLGLDGDGPPVGGHDAQIEARPLLLYPAVDLLELLPGWLGGKGLHGQGVHARKVAPHGIVVRGEEQGHVQAPGADHLLGDLLHLELVGRVAVGEEEVDADGFDAQIQQLSDRSPRLILVQGDRLVAEDVGPLGHAAHEVAGHEGLVVLVGADVEPVRVGVAEIALDPPLEAEVVLHPLGHDHADPAPLSLQEAVEHGGSRVDPGRQGGECLLDRHVPVGQGVPGGAEKALALVLRGRLGLAHHELPFIVDDEGVGQGSPGIDGQDPGCSFLCHLLSFVLCP